MVIEKLVYDSVALKSGIVNRDEKETGERRKLNFGHTFGHAIETVTGISHGEAVSAGMLVASELSLRRGLLPAEDAERIEVLLRKLRLPTGLQLNEEKLFDALRKDKKRKGDSVHFVFLNGIGNAVIEEISFEELKTAVHTILTWSGPGQR